MLQSETNRARNPGMRIVARALARAKIKNPLNAKCESAQVLTCAQFHKNLAPPAQFKYFVSTMSELGKQSSYWLFTINNPPEPRLSPDRFFSSLKTRTQKAKFLVYQYEHPEGGTRHIQGYVVFSGRPRGSTVKSMLGGTAHVETRKGTHQQVCFFLFCSFYYFCEFARKDSRSLLTGRGLQSEGGHASRGPVDPRERRGRTSGSR